MAVDGPKRLAETQRLKWMLAEALPQMREVVVHNRPSSIEPEGADRTKLLKGCVVVEVWEEADGSESLVIRGDSAMGDLEIKGLLHDGVYMISHQGEMGYQP